jgi:hypothetical protein
MRTNTAERRPAPRGIGPQAAGFEEAAERGPAGVGAGQGERGGDGLESVAGEGDHAEVGIELAAVAAEYLSAVFDARPVHPVGIGVELLEQCQQFR